MVGHSAAGRKSPARASRREERRNQVRLSPSARELRAAVVVAGVACTFMETLGRLQGPLELLG